MKKRVVITGMGTINPLGNNSNEFRRNLAAGVSGIRPITQFDPTLFDTRIAGTILNFDALSCLDAKEKRRFSLFIQYAVYAAKEAVLMSKLDIAAEAEQIGVIIGSGVGGIDIMEEQTRILFEKGPSRLSPFTVPMMITNMAAGIVAIKTGAKGPNSCTVTACASGTHSIGDAFRWIQNGESIAVIAGGTEAPITQVGVGGFCAAKTMTTRNHEPEKASRPFDKDRDGFVMGEGAGMVVLEELEHAKARGATIFAEVIGYGQSGDAYHMTAPAPNGEGGARAMKAAIADAGISPEQVDYINAHGTSTDLNDRLETEAIKSVMGNHAYNVSISSTKSMTGHLLGAAGAVEALAMVYAICDNVIPPTMNCDEPSEGLDLDYTPNQAKNRIVNIAMSNSFGFGGHNAVLIFKKYTE